MQYLGSEEDEGEGALGEGKLAKLRRTVVSQYFRFLTYFVFEQ